MVRDKKKGRRERNFQVKLQWIAINRYPDTTDHKNLIEIFII